MGTNGALFTTIAIVLVSDISLHQDHKAIERLKDLAIH